ncbi:leucine-rich repeat domain-containing protein [Roseburia sp. 499]|uniref:leucine-rich repeat domain-containing protein n=1 Tax=Roseburia sp. 499 TaxID=1261634 RepID=UPI000952C0FA|nr:leucine-rich repeat domain-containing protein [Roseburia sp. 499]WVK70597.1 hypothetical protein BIV20_03445 [Roseburia sp. 499]
MKKKKIICITLAVIVIACIAGYIIIGQIKKKEAEAAKANFIEIPVGIEVNVEVGEDGKLKKDAVDLVKLISIDKLDESNYKEVAALVNSSVNIEKLELNLHSGYEVDMKYLSYFNLANKELDVTIGGYDERSLQELIEIKQIGTLEIYPKDYNYNSNATYNLNCNQLSNVRTLELYSLIVNEKSGINTMTRLQTLNMTQCEVNGFGDCSGMDALEKIEMIGVSGEDFTGIANAPNEMEFYIEMSGIEQKAWDSLRTSKIALLTIKDTSIESFEFTEDMDVLKKLNYYFDEECADLSKLQKLDYISLFSDEIKQEHADMLSQLTNIKGIGLNGNILIEDYSGIQKLPQIKEVTIYTESDVPLAALGNMPQLEKLYLAKGKVDNISMLGNLTKLKVLDVSETEVSDISVLSNMPDLEELYIDDTEVSDISVLSNLTKLKVLNISGTEVSDISVLNNKTELKELRVIDTRISDISVLSSLDDLEILYMNGTEVSDISAISNATKMRKLVISGTKVSDISMVNEMTALEELRINETNVSDISVLRNNTQLRVLDMDDTEVRDISVLANMSKLKRLYIEQTKISDLSAISNCAELEVLVISGTSITDLSPLAKLKNLDSVYAKNVQVKDWSPVQHVRIVDIQ